MRGLCLRAGRIFAEWGDRQKRQKEPKNLGKQGAIITGGKEKRNCEAGAYDLREWPQLKYCVQF